MFAKILLVCWKKSDDFPTQNLMAILSILRLLMITFLLFKSKNNIILFRVFYLIHIMHLIFDNIPNLIFVTTLFSIVMHLMKLK